MTNILPFSTSFYANRIDERLGAAATRVGNTGPTHEVSRSSDTAGVRDNVTIKAGARVDPSLIGRVGMTSGLREASSLLQVADAGLSRIDGKLNEMRALAEVAATNPMGKFERVVLNDAFMELMGESDKIVPGAEFNGKNPLAGFDQDVDLGDGETMSISLLSMLMGDFAPDLASDDLLSQEHALKSIRDIDAAKEKVANVREDIAFMQARISAALTGGSRSLALDTFHGFDGQIDVGGEHARGISRQVVLEALMPRDQSDDKGPPAETDDRS